MITIQMYHDCERWYRLAFLSLQHVSSVDDIYQYKIVLWFCARNWPRFSIFGFFLFLFSFCFVFKIMWNQPIFDQKVKTFWNKSEHFHKLFLQRISNFFQHFSVFWVITRKKKRKKKTWSINHMPTCCSPQAKPITEYYQRYNVWGPNQLKILAWRRWPQLFLLLFILKFVLLLVRTCKPVNRDVGDDGA